MSFLKVLGVDETVREKALAAKKHAADIEAQTSSEGFPGFEQQEKEVKVISFAPGCSDFTTFAGVYADGDAFEAFIEAEAARQLTKLGFKPDDAIPSWAMIPERYAAQEATNVAFVGAKGIPNTGWIDYSEYPAERLRSLPATHPRNQALTIKSKFGATQVRNYIYLYCIEHTVVNGKFDNAKLKADLEMGTALKLLKLNGPSYSALKAAAQAAQMSGARFITDYHLVVQWSDFTKKTYNFNVNAAEPAWHSAELLPLVLKAVEKAGKPITHADVRKLSDDDFATLVRTVMAPAAQLAS